MDHRAPIVTTALAALLFLVPVLVSTPADAVRPYYKHFDDYLTSLSRKMPTPITEEMEELDDRAARKHKNLVFRKMAGNPGGHRQNTSCCMLGELAGDKGFHCYVQYYVARIAMRNRNRAHNRKLGFYGRYRVPRYGQRLMKTFEKCVAGHGAVFHKCCHLATLERRDRDPTYITRVPKSKGNKRHRHNNNNTTSDTIEAESNNNASSISPGNNNDTTTSTTTVTILELQSNMTTEQAFNTGHGNVTSPPNTVAAAAFNVTANYSMADEIETEDKELRSLL